MKKTLFKVIVCIFCVFSIAELSAQEDIDNLEKKNFFKIERLENELILLKDQYKLLTEQEKLNIEKINHHKPASVIAILDARAVSIPNISGPNNIIMKDNIN